MIDTHAHLIDSAFDNDRNKIILNMQSDNLEYIVNIGFDIESSKQCIKMAENFDRLYATIGVHPEEVSCWDENTFNTLKKLAKHPKVVGIGEIGLDYHYTKEDIELQKEIFVAQLKLAHECNLPVCIHNRDSIGDMLDILENNANLLTDGGVFHCFSESVEVYQRIKKLGLKVGFGGVCTFKNARKTLDVIRVVDVDDFVVETDCPYLAPEPNRGKRNEPKFVRFVIDKIAEIKGISPSEVEKISTQNALKLYKKIGVK